MKRWTMCLLLGLLLLLGSCSTAAEKGGYQLYFASGLGGRQRHPQQSPTRGRRTRALGN